jgi:hypothetical protein
MAVAAERRVASGAPTRLAGALSRALRRWPSWCPCAAIIAVAVVAVWPPVQHPAQTIKTFPDSATYLSWGFGRPPTTFLFYALVGSGRFAVVAQTVASVVSWTLFGWLALGWPGAVVAALVSAALPVSLWNYTVLSESIGLTLGAAVCAATLALGRRWSQWRFVVWSALALGFTGVRAENFFLLPPLLLALLACHRRRWRALLGSGAALAALFVAFSVVADLANHNWQIRMTNVVLTRIHPNAQLRAQFEALGLPRGDELTAWNGHMLAAYDPSFVAATPIFQHWLDGESRPAYLRWLATAEPHRQLWTWGDHALTRFDDLYNYYTAAVRYPPLVYGVLPLWDALRLPLIWWCALPLATVLIALAARRVGFMQLIPLAYAVAVYALFFVVYHADSGELSRHLALVGVLYRLAPLLALGGAWDALRPRLRPSRAATSAATSA